ncbi:MAG: PilZ domain-containing protein [Pseudomonadota bacterium]
MFRQDVKPRVFFDRPVSVFVPGRDAKIDGRALNLSAGGIFVCTDELLSPGTNVGLQFTLPTNEPIETKAMVLRTILPDDPLEPPGMAMRFDDLEQSDLRRLELLFQEQQQTQERDPIHLRLEELGVTISAKVQTSRNNMVAIDAQLPFLCLNSKVQLQRGKEICSGEIRWVSVHTPPSSTTPHLNIGVELDPAPCLSDEEQDPVYSDDFVDHTRDMDKTARQSRER